MQLCDFSKGLKNKFKTAVANGPSVIEPLKFHCIETEKSEQTHCLFRLLFLNIMFETEKPEKAHCLFRLLFLNIKFETEKSQQTLSQYYVLDIEI